MISAKEAYERTKKSHNENTQKILEEIENAIVCKWYNKTYRNGQ